MNTRIIIQITGVHCVGKTSILRCYCHDIFDEIPLFQAFPIYNKDIDINGHPISLTLKDLHGGEMIRHLLKNNYIGAQGIIIVFDITCRKSFNSVKSIIDAINDFNLPHEVITILVGNKLDLIKEREVSKEEAQSLAFKYKLHYFESSAKTNEGIDEIFTYLSTQIYTHYIQKNTQISQQIIADEKNTKCFCW